MQVPNNKNIEKASLIPYPVIDLRHPPPFVKTEPSSNARSALAYQEILLLFIHILQPQSPNLNRPTGLRTVKY